MREVMRLDATRTALLVGGLVCGLACSLAQAASTQRPPAVAPTDPGVVIERLPQGYARLMPTARTATSTAMKPSMTQIQRLLAAAAHTGDARLAARADAMLTDFPRNTRDADVLRARAYSAQYRHDFAGAVRQLDALIARDPRDGDARLSRTQINIVRGHLEQARADCASLVLGVDAGRGLLCVAMLSLRTGDYATAARTADRWLHDSVSHGERWRYALRLRAEIAARAGEKDVDAQFRRALEPSPDDVRTLAAYARFLRHAGRHRDATELLAARTDHDGLQLQRALAAQRSDPAQATALAAAQARRYALAHALGSEPELRDEAEFLLTLRHDPAAALALAQRNFQTQRDFEDVSILQRAAVAARRPQALEALHAWAQSQRLPLPSPTVEAR